MKKLKADTSPYFKNCPRCGEGGLESLSTHTFCVNCNYSTCRMNFNEHLEQSYNQALQMEKQLEKTRKGKTCPLIELERVQNKKRLVS